MYMRRFNITIRNFFTIIHSLIINAMVFQCYMHVYTHVHVYSSDVCVSYTGVLFNLIAIFDHMMRSILRQLQQLTSRLYFCVLALYV